MFGKRKDTDSLFTPSVVARLKTLETFSRGAVNLPQGNIFRAMISKSPVNPTLQVVALRRNDHDTVVYAGMGVPGETELRTADFTIGGTLTSTNAPATGASIAKLLGDPSQAKLCAAKLMELVGRPPGQLMTFTVDDRKQLAITEGEGR